MMTSSESTVHAVKFRENTIPQTLIKADCSLEVSYIPKCIKILDLLPEALYELEASSVFDIELSDEY